MAAELERIYLSKYLTLDRLDLITVISLTNFLDSDGELSFICSEDLFLLLNSRNVYCFVVFTLSEKSMGVVRLRLNISR